MKSKGDMLAAISAVAASAGVSIASGRQIVLYFAQLQEASWTGVFAASILFGALCGTAAWLAARSGSRDFAGVCVRELPGRWTTVVYGLLMIFAAAAMAAESGRLAELSLPLHNAYWMGIVFSFGLASMLCIRGRRCWGMAAVAMCGLFYAALALDPRPVRLRVNYETELRLAGSVPAALLLGALHAALSGSMAVHYAASDSVRSPAALALSAGGMMFFLLAAANAAMLRGGERLLSQPLPAVVLAARWGKAGFYGCILVKWMCCVATLCAALDVLTGRRLNGCKKRQNTC